MATVLDRAEVRAWSLGLLAAGLAALAAIFSIGHGVAPFELSIGYASGLGAGTVTFLAVYVPLGLAGTLAIAGALVRLWGPGADRLARAWRAGPDAAWLAGFAVLAALVPLAIRAYALHGTPIVDDESAYRYSAELLAHGRLVGDSPPVRLAFDRSFMVNDGRFYSQYFLGWPALAAPGVALGIPGAMNAIYGALALPAVFLVVRRLAGSSAARLAALLYVASPLLSIAAATELSHTTCFAALAWLTWAVLRATDDDAPAWTHAAVGAAFGVAFFIRPTSAIGVGAPLVVAWGLAVRRRGGRAARRALVAWAIPTAALAAAFLAVNAAQNGSPLRSAYAAAVGYARANGFRFTHWNASNAGLETAWWGWPHALANTGLATLRMNAALLGWPVSLFFVGFAWRAPRTAMLWASVGWFVAFHTLVKNVGVDVFGPVHYFELALPLLVLTAVGIARAGELAARLGTALGATADWRRGPALLAATSVATALVLYAPLQLAALRATTRRIEQVLALPDAVPGRIVVFTRHPLVDRRCLDTKTWVMWRPNNDPDLANRVLWANHITADRDRAVVAALPGRTGYILDEDVGRNCQLRLVPLASPAADALAPGVIGGTGAID